MNSGAVLTLAVLLGACTVGPDYARPATAVPAAYKEAGPWQPAQPLDGLPRGAWWLVFHDPGLDVLAAQIAPANQSIAAAAARSVAARALVQAARAGSWPQAGITASATRRGEPSATSLLLSANAAWEPDVWGRIRRGVEASEANADASAADLAAATLSLQADLAIDYFALRTQDAQSALMRQVIADYQRSLDLTRSLFATGMVSRADVLLAETQLRAAEVQAIELGVQRALLEHAIAVLTGQPPSALSLPPIPLDSAPPAIPPAQPSTLLQRRPDIAAAERRMAAANAEVGVATAAFYPAITLGASGGFSGASLATLLDWPGRVWSLGTGLSATLLDGGLRTAQRDAARATYDATVADYRQIVLAGFQEVEDGLATLRILEREAAAQIAADQAARRSLAVALTDYSAGIVSYFNVITAQTAAKNTARGLQDVAGRRMAASVQLIRALGGAWESPSR